MPKVKRILRAARFKYLNLLNYISKFSNCILFTVFFFIAAVFILMQDNEPVEDIVAPRLDDFQKAHYVKHSNQHSTLPKALSTMARIENVKTVTVSKFATKEISITDVPAINKIPVGYNNPMFPLILLKEPKEPVIKMFYRGKQPRLKIKTTEKKVSANKLTYRDVFYAMAHPRLFPTTTEKYEEMHEAHVKTGLNDWIRANNPRDQYKLLVYSAYWDDRFDNNNFVRVIAVMVIKNPPPVYCRLQTDDGKFNDVTVSRKIMNEHWRLKYASYFLSCESSKKIPPPTKVLISLNRNFTFSAMLPVYQSKIDAVSPKGDIAVCVKPLHYYYDRATWLLEFIEFHRILGVEHFFFYNHTVGENVDTLLRDYMKQKIVTVLPWNLPVRSQKEIRTEGIFSSLNDCVYRTMYKYHYVILLDFDEYIVPREHDNYLDLLHKIEEDNKHIRGKPGSFVFRNTFFYLYWENDTTAYGSEPEKTPQWIPYFVTQYKTRRLSTSMKIGSRSKYIAIPHKVVEVGNHVVWRHTSGSRAIPVPDNTALLHHYRICEFGGFSCLKKPSLVDRTANRFGEELLDRVLEQCARIYPNLTGKCPVSPPLGSPW